MSVENVQDNRLYLWVARGRPLPLLPGVLQECYSWAILATRYLGDTVLCVPMCLIGRY